MKYLKLLAIVLGIAVAFIAVDYFFTESNDEFTVSKRSLLETLRHSNMSSIIIGDTAIVMSPCIVHIDTLVKNLKEMEGYYGH